MPSDQQKKAMVLEALERYERPLLRYAMRLLNGDETLARDIVQHSFMKLCERQERELSIAELGRWLYVVCRNRAIDWIRKSGRETATDCASKGAVSREPDPTVQLEQRSMLKLVQQLMEQLAPAEREIAELWSQGFTHSEMAGVTGKSEIAIRVCLHRAIKSLRQHPAIQTWIAQDQPKASAAMVSGLANDMGGSS